MQKEIWKDIPEYEGFYQASTIGRIKSIPRQIIYKDGRCFYSNGKILKQTSGTRGYLIVNLSKNGRCKMFRIHVLIAITFLNHKPNGFSIVCDHIDNVRTNNILSNIQLTTNRINSTKDQKAGTSNHVGVYLHKASSKWRASIHLNGKSKHLGLFSTELEASEAYQNELIKINQGL